MKHNTYKWILYAIVGVIATTIAIQVYWNYKNYLNNKQQLINDVQGSLDKAIDDYYALLAQRTTVGIFLEGDQRKDVFKEGGDIDNFLRSLDSIDSEKKEFVIKDSIELNKIPGVTVLRGRKIDSMENLLKNERPVLSPGLFKYKMDSIKAAQNVEFEDFSFLTSKIVVSITNDSLDLMEVDSLLKEVFRQKNMNIEGDLKFYKSSMSKQVARIKDSIEMARSEIKGSKKEYELTATSKSTFLPKGSIVELNYDNSTLTILRRSLSGIVISSILVLAVISCLFYLLHIIKRQKQLAEVKNDLISNITHEFKTPIATIGVALESIRDFNGIDDKEKTKKYLSMSSQQLDKLNVMVEKLLETATLDSDKLELNKDSYDVVDLLKELHHRYEVQFPDKTFNLSIKCEEQQLLIDVFHFENALNNILDNAVKYGGNAIFIDLIPKETHVEINIADNGNKLSKANKERIFEKFYRVPKGNTHDVKGFGIGLFYTKTIIEKHGGQISVDIDKRLTTFKITIPNG